MKKKVFNVMFSKRLGGIEQSFLDYSEALKNEFDVVALINSECKVKAQVKTEYKEIKQFNKYDPFAILRIRRVIRKHQPNLIIAHSTRAYVLCKLATKSVPIIAVTHNHNYKHILKSKYIIAITSIMKNELLDRCKSKVFLVPNMINLDAKTKYTPPKFHKPLRVGFIGTLTYIKGVDLLLNAASKITKKGLKVKLFIAGQGEEIENLKKMSAELGLDVDFLGWVNEKAKENFFKEIDILCIPSRTEPFGIVILEAMKHSKPLVTTRTNGALEVAKNIAAFADATPKSLAAAIIKLVKRPSIATKMAKKGFEEVSNYSQEKIAQKLHKIVWEVIAAHENL